METIYTVDYFIKKFESIPDKKWGVNHFVQRRNIFSPIKCCAAGFCMPKELQAQVINIHKKKRAELNLNINDYPEWNALAKLFGGWSRVGEINNGNTQSYQQPTPKQRILQALYDIKAEQQPEVKERIVYVTVDQKVRELQKAETLTN